MPLEYKINKSVGRKSKGAVNQTADVKTVQNMLRLAAMIEADPKLDPGGVERRADLIDPTPRLNEWKDKRPA